MRFVVELHHLNDGVEGVVIPQGSDEQVPFSGWLELLRLLEELQPLPGDEPAGG